MEWRELIVAIAEFLGSLFLFWWTRRLVKLQNLLIESSRELSAYEEDFQQTKTAFVLGITQAREIREERMEEARWN